jgi:DNA-binding transcriptional regulator YiaG
MGYRPKPLSALASMNALEPLASIGTRRLLCGILSPPSPNIQAAMSNITAAIKTEIERLSKKVVRQHVDPLSAASKSYRRDISALKKQVGALEKEVVKLRRSAAPKASKEVASETETNFRFVAKGFKSLRERLGLSADDIGLLLGVSAQSVYNWEHGKTTPRSTQLPVIAAIRGIGKKQALARLEQVTANRN